MIPSARWARLGRLSISDPKVPDFRTGRQPTNLPFRCLDCCKSKLSWCQVTEVNDKGPHPTPLVAAINSSCPGFQGNGSCVGSLYFDLSTCQYVYPVSTSQLPNRISQQIWFFCRLGKITKPGVGGASEGWFGKQPFPDFFFFTRPVPSLSSAYLSRKLDMQPLSSFPANRQLQRKLECLSLQMV